MSSSSKGKRSGGKFTGNHTSLIPGGAVIADICDGCVWVRKISPGFIKAGLRSGGGGGKRRVKFMQKNAGFKLSVRDNTSHQEIHIFVDEEDLERAKEYLMGEIEKADFIVSFR